MLRLRWFFLLWSPRRLHEPRNRLLRLPVTDPSLLHSLLFRPSPLTHPHGKTSLHLERRRPPGGFAALTHSRPPSPQSEVRQNIRAREPVNGLNIIPVGLREQHNGTGVLDMQEKTRFSSSQSRATSICVSTSLTGVNGGPDACRLKHIALTLPCPGDPPFHAPSAGSHWLPCC